MNGQARSIREASEVGEAEVPTRGNHEKAERYGRRRQIVSSQMETFPSFLVCTVFSSQMEIIPPLSGLCSVLVLNEDHSPP